jgi:uncharacterized protein (TIGR00369 family)
MSGKTRREIIQDFVPGSPFARRVGLGIERIEPDRVELRMPFDPELATIGEIVHGGAIATLVDTAGMVAAWSDDVVPETLAGSTVGLSVDFVAAAEGVDVTALASVIRRGRSLCFVDVDVVDPGGTAVAKGLVTYRYG